MWAAGKGSLIVFCQQIPLRRLSADQHRCDHLVYRFADRCEFAVFMFFNLLHQKFHRFSSEHIDLLSYCLLYTSVPDLVKSINGLMITTPVLTRPMVENIRVACREMGFPRNRCFLQDYEESFYYHTLYQKPEIWSRSVGLFVFDKDEVSYAKLEMNRSTRPVHVGVRRGGHITLHTEYMPVSYTHLDVYKRQSVHFSWWNRE